MREQIATIDFETDEILPRPQYPPKPVGMALRLPGGKTAYHAWAHPEGNNCTQNEARRIVRDVWRNYTLLGFNMAFDLEVAEEHLGVKRPAWDRVHDAMLLAFLHDPNSKELDLKTLAERHCEIKHTELDLLREWIFTHVPGAKKAPTKWGRFISHAPAALAGRYAKRDVRDTWALWRFYGATRASMVGAYDRERQLLPHLSRMGARGVPVSEGKLLQADRLGTVSVTRVENWIRKRLHAPSLETWTGDKLADVIEDAGKVCDEGWIATAKGKRSTSKENLPLAVDDKFLCGALEARSLLAKQLSTFVRPWLIMGGERIYCQWHQVRNTDQNSTRGARTGRLSTAPNFQNVPVRARVFHLPPSLRDIGPLGLRACIEAPKGQRIFAEDYSQQELRLLAHFAGGPLLAGYQANPRMDMHEFAQDLINTELGSSFERWQIKNTGFGLIYGMGLALLSKKIGASYDEAKLLKRVYLDRLELRPLMRELEGQDSVTTWGGRICPEEDPIELKDGTLIDLGYKKLNTLIQGSAGDQTKQAMIDYCEQEPDNLILSVHDECVGVAPTRDVRRHRKVLRNSMTEQTGFALAFPTDGAHGKTWRDCKN